MFESSNYTERTKSCLEKLSITESTLCQCGKGMGDMSFTRQYSVSNLGGMHSAISLMDGFKLNIFFSGGFPDNPVQLVCENCGNIVRNFCYINHQ